MLDNELNKLLADIEKKEFSDASEGQSKYKTSDFDLDSILKEYGINDTHKPQKHKDNADKKEEKPAPIENIKPSEPAAPVASEKKLEKEEKPVTVPEEHKQFNVVSVSEQKTVEEVKPEPKLEKEEKKPEIKEEVKTEVEDIQASPVEVKAEKPDDNQKIDIFNNDEIVSLLAANKLGTSAASEEVEHKEITQMFTPEQEEDFKMRSGYIDLEAIRAATATINLKDKSNTVTKPVTEEMNTSQRALFGKIGSFFSDTTFRYDTSTVNELTVESKKKKNVKDNEEQVKKEVEPVAGDIREADDVPVVEQEMLSQLNLSFLKLILTAILSLPLAILDLFPNVLEDLLPSLAPSSPSNYAIANLTVLLIIAIVNINIVIKGIGGLFTLKPTGSTLASLAMISSLAYSVYAILKTPENIVMYGFVAALAVVFVLLGKYIYYRNVYKNFEILAFDSPKTACVVGGGGYSLKDLYTESAKETSCRPVSLLTNFLTNSFDCNFADTISKFGIVAAVIFGIAVIVYGALKGGINEAFANASLAFAAICPFCYDMAYSLPFNMVSNKIRKTGSAVVSYTVAKDFVNTDKLIMCDSDLFKPENIVVHSMKINGNEKINDVIINCASIINASGSPVAGAFLNILDNKNDMLMPVTELDWAPGKGYSGNINGMRYYIGTSQYLADCGIKLPSIDLEEKYRRIGRQVIMFADSRKLLAVFSISYSRDEIIYKNLHKISLNEMSILVLTRDCNITSELLSEIYEMDEGVFKIAGKEEFERNYHNDRPIEKYPAKVYSITGAGGVTSALSNCKRLTGTVKISVVFRTIALIMSVALLVYAVFTGNVSELLSVKNIILFHLLWILPPVFVSLFAG